MKKKIITLVFILSTVCFYAKSQHNTSTRYQGDIQVGYSVGIGKIAYDRVNLHFVNSARFNDYFSAGVGIGADIYTDFVYDEPEVALPIYLNLKGYYPVSDKTSLFLSFDIGASIGLTEGMDGATGLLFVPAVGASFNIGGKKAVTLSLGYDYQAWSESIVSLNTDAIQLKLGLTF